MVVFLPAKARHLVIRNDVHLRICVKLKKKKKKDFSQCAATAGSF